MLFSLKSYAKKCFTVWRNYFLIKSYSTFSAKMFQAPSFGNVYYRYTLYGRDDRDCKEEEKTDKTWQNEMDTKTVKIATSEIHFSILKRNFTTIKDFFA